MNGRNSTRPSRNREGACVEQEDGDERQRQAADLTPELADRLA
jgi:hypothetical protein